MLCWNDKYDFKKISLKVNTNSNKIYNITSQNSFSTKDIIFFEVLSPTIT